MMDPTSWLGLGIELGTLIGFLIATWVFRVLKWVQGGLQQQFNRAIEDLDAKSGRISDLEQAQNSDTQRISGLQTEIRVKEAEIVRLSAQASRVWTLEQEKVTLEQQLQHQRAELAQLPDLRETESEVNRLRPLTAEVAQLRNAIDTKDTTISQLQEDHARVRERVIRLVTQLDFVRQELVNKEEELERLRPPQP
jgi:chromosome segregation ATPase